MKMTVKMFGEERELTIAEGVSDFAIGDAVGVVCDMIVGDGENYRPWMRDFYVNLGLYSLFVAEPIPDGYTDEDVMAFFKSDEWVRMKMRFPAEKMERFEDWVDEKTDVLVDMYFRSGASLWLKVLVGAVERLKGGVDKGKEEKVE